jgi:hypothetical protein
MDGLIRDTTGPSYTATVRSETLAALALAAGLAACGGLATAPKDLAAVMDVYHWLGEHV